MSKSQAQLATNKQHVRQMLGLDPRLWSRECVLPYPRSFERSIDLLLEAAVFVSQGDSGRDPARDLIKQMDDQEMRSWFDDFAQNAGKVRLEMLGRKPQVPTGKSTVKRPSPRFELDIIRRDGFHCRYCGMEAERKSPARGGAVSSDSASYAFWRFRLRAITKGMAYLSSLRFQLDQATRCRPREHDGMLLPLETVWAQFEGWQFRLATCPTCAYH